MNDQYSDDFDDDDEVKELPFGWLGDTLPRLSPIGVVVMHTGDIEPDGWSFCDGRALSREDYHRLFETMGTRFGEGDGNTTFNLPNLSDFAPGIRYLIRIGKLYSESDD